MKILKSTKIEKETKVTKTIKLDKEDIIEYLKLHGFETVNNCTIEAFVTIPSGGDYSGMNLDIDADFPIIVKIIRETSKTIS